MLSWRRFGINSPLHSVLAPGVLQELGKFAIQGDTTIEAVTSKGVFYR